MTLHEFPAQRIVQRDAADATPVALRGCSHQELTEWLTAKVAHNLHVAAETIDVETPLADYGIDSAMALMLCADLESEKGISAETTLVWDYATIDAIAGHLAHEAKS